jgi:hypothetical protein
MVNADGGRFTTVSDLNANGLLKDKTVTSVSDRWLESNVAARPLVPCAMAAS